MKRPSFFVFIALASFKVCATSQTAPQVVPGPAPNAWMKTPSGDEISIGTPAYRTARDFFWDNSVAGRRAPLTPENAGVSALSGGSFSPKTPEISKFPNRTIVTATFTSFQSILTTSHHTVYTEIHLRVHEVLEGSQASTDSFITVTVPGGTVRMPDGKVISYLTQPRDMFLQPGRTYLLVLSYRPSGDFYLMGEDWDISDGTAKPNSDIGKWRLEKGHSLFGGKPTDEALRDLRKYLAEPRVD